MYSHISVIIKGIVLVRDYVFLALSLIISSFYDLLIRLMLNVNLGYNPKFLKIILFLLTSGVKKINGHSSEFFVEFCLFLCRLPCFLICDRNEMFCSLSYIRIISSFTTVITTVLYCTTKKNSLYTKPVYCKYFLGQI